MLDYPELLEQINFKVNPINSRNKPTFYVLNANTKYMLYSPAHILISAAVITLIHVDLFSTLYKFSCNLKNTYYIFYYYFLINYIFLPK